MPLNELERDRVAQAGWEQLIAQLKAKSEAPKPVTVAELLKAA